VTDLQQVLLPGDVLAVRGGGLAGTLIRLGAALADKPNLSGHVAVMHHYDSGGVPWGLEGRPGGVGWVDLRAYVESPWTMNNCRQPDRTEAQRARVAKAAEGMLGTPYDWQAILGDGFDDLHVKLWNLPGFAERPGQVVCSSFAAYLYEQEKWPHPGLNDERYCQPADWDTWIVAHGYNVSLH